MQMASEIKVLKLEGPPRKRGQIHGEALRGEICEQVERWKDHLQQSIDMDADAYIGQFLAETDLLTAVKRWTPDLLEEVEGIADGSGIGDKTITALQMVDEEWWYRAEKGLTPYTPAADNCSALGVFGQKGLPTIVAQNLDCPDYFDGYQVILHVKDPGSEIESFVFTTAGFIAMNGVNNHGVGIVCNALLQLNHAGDGLPVAFVHRGVLAQPTLDEAVAFLHRIKHASGQNYILGGAEKAVSFECSANKVSQFVPDWGDARLYHANHPLANDDLIAPSEPEKDQRRDEKRFLSTPSNSETRCRSLESRLADTTQRVTVETVKEILGSHDSDEHPVCRHKTSDGGTMTIGCQIMVLSNPPQLHVAPGPPCSTPFSVISF